MKKIFAIALALVMVLSMASAFASACKTGPFNWTCPTTDTNCGKATVEVVPYVTTNSACNEVSYVQSDCAAAINGENVYFALKMTIDEDIDPEWWAKVRVFLTVKGMKEYTANEAEIMDGVSVAAATDASEDGWVYYYVIGKGWVEATENADFDIADVMNKYTVAEYAKAKVCFELTSEYENFTRGVVGDYVVTYSADDKIFVVTENKANTDNEVVYILDNDLKVTGIIKANDKCSTTFYNAVTAFFGIAMDTCLNQDTVDANLGWDEEVESCYSWKTQNAMAVVDADCVVAIPKTGDASVLAWLF